MLGESGTLRRKERAQTPIGGGSSTIAPSACSEWQFIEERSIDDAFFDLRRRQCGYVVAKAADLKTLMLALRRERRDYTFAPVWFDEQQAAAAAFEARDEQEESIRKEEERKRADADKEQLRKQRERDRQQEKTERSVCCGSRTAPGGAP